MLRAFVVLVVLVSLLGACTQKVVCPAYQSAFIYDKDELRKKFSYFQEDSTPKLASVKKTKYLIAEPTSFKKKTRSLQTVEAKPVNPVIPDSLLLDDEIALGSDLDAAARSVIDSTYIVDTEATADSTAADAEEYVISLDKEVRVLKYNAPDSMKYIASIGKYVPERPSYYIVNVGFNVEQGNYLWYLRDVLVLPDVRLAKMAEQKKEEEQKSKKGIKGFFSGLFKKKDKQNEQLVDSTKTKSADMDEYNFDEFEDVQKDTATQAESKPVKEKGVLSIFKRKEKSKKQKQPKQKADKKEPEPVKKDEDDGF